MQQKPSIGLKRFLGYGLLEIALGIAVAALLVAWAMMYFQNASNERLANESVEQVAAVISAVHSMYNGQPDYEGLTTARVAASPLLPAKYRKGNQLKTPYAGALEVTTAVSGYNSGTNRFLVISYNLPKDACIKLATHDLNPERIYINGVAVRTPDGGLARRATVQQASQGCSNRSNRIHWDFK